MTKNRFFRTLLLCAGLSLCTSACAFNGAKDTPISDSSVNASPEVSQTDSANDLAKTAVSSDPFDYVFATESYPQYEGDRSFPITYELKDNHDNTGVVRITSLLNDSLETIATYKGVLTAEQDSLILDYYSDDEPNWHTYFVFSMEGDRIVDAYEYNQNLSAADYAGTYQGTSDLYGDLELHIFGDGNVEMNTSEGYYFSGSIYNSASLIEILLSDYDNDLSLDWYIELYGDTFSYTSYYYTLYHHCAGSYSCFGALGDFVLTVDDEGNASATVPIDGALLFFEGQAYTDDSGEMLGGATLYNENGYSLDLEIKDISFDGEPLWNYSGHLSTPLSAG